MKKHTKLIFCALLCATLTMTAAGCSGSSDSSSTSTSSVQSADTAGDMTNSVVDGSPVVGRISAITDTSITIEVMGGGQKAGGAPDDMKDLPSGEMPTDLPSGNQSPEENVSPPDGDPPSDGSMPAEGQQPPDGDMSGGPGNGDGQNASATLTISLDTDTVFTNADGTTITTADLAVGDMVTIDLGVDGVTATSVQIQDAMNGAPEGGTPSENAASN